MFYAHIKPFRTMAQRKSRRIAERSVGFGEKIGDDPMLEIDSYLEKPMYWNKDTRDRYSCTPTNVSYRVLGRPDGSCPIEARIPELIPGGPDGALSRCCTSRQGPTSHEESLWFLRALKAVHAGAGGVVWTGLIPYNLRRILDWINHPANASVGVVNPAAQLVVTSDTERYLDIFKLALMVVSSTPVMVRLPNSVVNEAMCQSIPNPGFPLEPMVSMNESTPLHEDLVRVMNEVNGIAECTLLAVVPFVHQRVCVHPVRTTTLRINNDINNSRCVDVADITNHFDAGVAQRWVNQRRCIADAFAVVRSATTIEAEMVSLFQVMKNLDALTFVPWSRAVSVQFGLHVGHLLPAGYTGVRFQPGDIHTIGQAMAATVPNPIHVHLGSDPGVLERFSFRYRHGPSFWIKVVLRWQVVSDTLQFGLAKNP